MAITSNLGRVQVIHRGEWENDVAYVGLDEVYYNKNTYRVKKGLTPAAGTLPTDTDYFDVVTSTTVIPTGAYNALTEYNSGNIVLHEGSSWICILGNVGNVPPSLPAVSNTYWQLLAKKGDKPSHSWNGTLLTFENPDGSPGDTVDIWAAGADIRDTAQAWAEGTEPGGPGTKSAKEYSEELGDVAAAVSATEADAIATAADRVQTGLDVIAAEAARDAALATAAIYLDIPTGRAAVSDGEQFSVNDGIYITRYQRVDASSETEMAKFLTAAAIIAMNPVEYIATIYNSTGVETGVYFIDRSVSVKSNQKSIYAEIIDGDPNTELYSYIEISDSIVYGPFVVEVGTPTIITGLSFDVDIGDSIHFSVPLITGGTIREYTFKFVGEPA